MPITARAYFPAIDFPLETRRSLSWVFIYQKARDTLGTSLPVVLLVDADYSSRVFSRNRFSTGDSSLAFLGIYSPEGERYTGH